MSEQWSKSTRSYTRLAFENFSFATRANRVWMKSIDGGVGYFNDDDALSERYALYSLEGALIETFPSIEAFINRGWVLD